MNVGINLTISIGNYLLYEYVVTDSCCIKFEYMEKAR